MEIFLILWPCSFSSNDVVVVVDSHIRRMTLATEETTVTRPVSHRPSNAYPACGHKRGTKVNGSHYGDNLLLNPAGTQIATNALPDSTTREHRKCIGVKTMSLGTNYRFYCLGCCQSFKI